MRHSSNIRYDQLDDCYATQAYDTRPISIRYLNRTRRAPHYTW